MLVNFKHFKTKSNIWEYLHTALLCPNYPLVVQLLGSKSISYETGNNMEWVMKALRSLNEIQKLSCLTPIRMNKINLTPLNCCSFPFTVIRPWNNNPVTCFHLSKIGVSSEQFRSFFTDFYIVTIVLHMVHASLFNRGNTFKRFIHSQTMNYPRY